MTPALLDLIFTAAQPGLPTPALIERFGRAAAAVGFPYMVSGAWFGARARNYRFHFSTWPDDWVAIYQRGEFFARDPVVMRARTSFEAFLLTEMREEERRSPVSRPVIEALDAYGWRECFAVPVHGPAGYTGLITLASMTPVTLARADRLLLEAACRIVHERCRHMSGEADGGPALTKRQHECLALAAIGKSEAEIAALLALAPATVHFHIEEAKKRLGARSRAEAIGLMVLRGLL